MFTIFPLLVSINRCQVIGLFSDDTRISNFEFVSYSISLERYRRETSTGADRTAHTELGICALSPYGNVQTKLLLTVRVKTLLAFVRVSSDSKNVHGSRDRRSFLSHGVDRKMFWALKQPHRLDRILVAKTIVMMISSDFKNTYSIELSFKFFLNECF